ncbi:MAG: nitrite reductase large subunit, partial [Maritimibacter sp.]
LDWVQAVMQLYRENGRYLDRIYKWVEKVGLDWVQAQVGDAETRAGLIERFRISQSIYQHDPWAEHVTEQQARYQPLAVLTLEAAE